MTFSASFELPTTQSRKSVAACFTPTDTLLPLETIYRHYFDDDAVSDEVEIFTPNENYNSAEVLDVSTYQGGGVVSEGRCNCCYFKPDTLIPYAAATVAGTGAGTLGAYVQPTPNFPSLVGAAQLTTVVPLKFISKRGKLIDVDMELQHIFGNGLMTFGGAGIGFTGNGSSTRLRINFKVKSSASDGKKLPVNLGLIVGSVQTPNEEFRARGTATSPELSSVDLFLNPGNVVATYPASGIFVTNPNDQAGRFIGFENRTEVSIELNGSANRGLGLQPYLYGGADVYELDNCATHSQGFSNDCLLDERLSIIEADLQEIPAPAPGDEPITVKAAGSVAQNGTVQEAVNATVVKVGGVQGTYDVAFTTPAPTATYPVLVTMGALPQNDDYQWAYLNRTINGFRIEIREQDNGGAAGVLRDSDFSFQVLTLG